MPPLNTRRLVLRLLESDALGDEKLFVHLYTDPAVMRRIAFSISPEEAARAFQAACRHNGRPSPGHRYWRIDWRGQEEGRPAGIGIVALRRQGNTAELGVMLREGAWNRGISSESFTVVLAHAFGPMGLAMVYAERPEDDHALIIDRLLDGFGFARAPQRALPGRCRWELPREVWLQREWI